MPDQASPPPQPLLCPFCGADPKCDETRYRGVVALREYQCPDADCPMSRLPFMTECDWNTRHPSPDVAKLVEAAKKLVEAADDSFKDVGGYDNVTQVQVCPICSFEDCYESDCPMAEFRTALAAFPKP